MKPGIGAGGPVVGAPAEPASQDLIQRGLDAGFGAEEVKLWPHGAAERDDAEANLVGRLHGIKLRHVQDQLRLLAALLASSLIFDLVDPALLLLAGTHSLILTAAEPTAFGPLGVGVTFLVLAALVLPFLAVQCGWRPAARRGVTKFTCAVLAVAGLLWFFLSWNCVQLHMGTPPALIFARNGAGAILFALALGVSLNADLLRLRMECAQ